MTERSPLPDTIIEAEDGTLLLTTSQVSLALGLNLVWSLSKELLVGRLKLVPHSYAREGRPLWRVEDLPKIARTLVRYIHESERMAEDRVQYLTGKVPGYAVQRKKIEREGIKGGRNA